MTMLNEHLEHLIKQQLLANEDLSSQRIETIANDGDITLKGSVQSFRRKLAAQQVVESCEHVKSVINSIEVAPPEIKSDVAIAAQTNQRLEEAADLTGESVRVTAKDQTIALTGYVKTEHEKVRAADIAASVDGVVEVDNFLVANPDQVLANFNHSQKIQSSMANVIGMENEKLRVSVVNESARLSGEVDSPWKREMAEKVTRQYEILNVLNEIVVRPIKQPSG